MVVMTESSVEQHGNAAAEEMPQNSVTRNSATLYNFGYAPVEVIEKFQWFCFQHNTLTEAISALLERDKLLVNKYRFMKPPVLYQMLAKPTDLDLQSAVKKAMISLHKYTKEGRYKSVADAIEELLISPELSDFVPMARGTDKVSYTMVTPHEEEALNKIADALFQRVKSMAPTGVKKPLAKKRTSPNKSKTAEQPSKLTLSILKQVKSSRTHDDDPDYDPESSNKSMQWSKKQLINSMVMHKGSEQSDVDRSLLNAPDSKVNIPLKRFAAGYEKPESQQVLWQTLTKACVMQDGQTEFLFNQLNLLPTKVCKDFALVCDTVTPMLCDYNT